MLLFYLTIKAHKPKLSFHDNNLKPESPTTMHSFTFIVTAVLVLMTAAAPLAYADVIILTETKGGLVKIHHVINSYLVVFTAVSVLTAHVSDSYLLI